MMTAQTKQNVNAAMLNEALANAKYLRFAACARMNGHPELADLFQKTADADRAELFCREFGSVNVCDDDIANLKSAIRDKGYQIDMYCQFAAQARTNDDRSVAELFDWLRSETLDEMITFGAALESIASRGEKEKQRADAAVAG